MVTVHRSFEFEELGFPHSWNEVDMREYVSTPEDPKPFKVRSAGDRDVGLHKGNGETYYFPFFVLNKVFPKLPDNIKISSDYEVVFKHDKSIEVGCQTIPFELLEKIYETAKGITQ
jgi:hypothetical protein